MFVDEVLQRLAEFGGIAQGPVDERITHDLTTHLDTGFLLIGHCSSSYECWRRQALNVLKSRNAQSAGRMKNSIRRSSLSAIGMPVVNHTTCRPWARYKPRNSRPSARVMR